jgi:protein-disulfide isomerase
VGGYAAHTLQNSAPFPYDTEEPKKDMIINEPPQEKRNGIRKWVLAIAAALAVLVIGWLVVILVVKPVPGGGAGGRPALTPTDPAPLDAAPSIGPKTAHVTIIEYADFGCPSCWFWYKQGVLDQLLLKYGEQIRFIWRDYPVITLDSPDAAEAGQCANEQGKFWEFHAAVYQHNGAISSSDLEAYATTIGLNKSQFDECFTSHRYLERVNAEQHEAFSHGFNGAPFFLINDKILIGPQSLQVFESMIDPMLASK